MSGHLATVHELHRRLTSLAQAETRLAGIPEWMQELHDEHSREKAEIEAAEAAAEEAERERREAEAALADAQSKLEHFQGQISRVTTQKEYGALLKEIDGVKQIISEQEQAALEAMETVDAKREEKATLSETFEALDERYKDALAKWEEEKPEIAERAKQLRGEVERLRGEIPRPQLSLYERLHERFAGDALAPVQRVQAAGNNSFWRCQACNYRVRPQLVVQIRTKGEIVQCDACKRILYDGTETAAEDGAGA